MEVSIRNTLEDAPITFVFETLAPEEEFDPIARSFKTQPSSALRCRYLWSGRTRLKITALKAQTAVRVPITARFFQPGVYNLNRFRFTVEQEGQKPRVFFFPLQYLISVHPPSAPSDFETSSE